MKGNEIVLNWNFIFFSLSVYTFYRAFRDYTMDKNLYTPPTKCHSPPKLQNKLWKDVDPDDFACQPRIIKPVNNDYLKKSDREVAIFCRAKGVPTPELSWLFNKKPLNAHDSRYNVKIFKEKRRKDSVDAITSELVISNPRTQDQGSYTCYALNSAGKDEMDFALDLVINSAVTTQDSTNILFIVLIVVVLLLILSLFICLCIYCKTSKKDQKGSTLLNDTSNGLSSTKIINNKMHNDSILEGGSVIMEMQTSLLTEVNPVEKPPRRAEVDSIGKEQVDEGHDAKQNLLDDSNLGECLN